MPKTTLIVPVFNESDIAYNFVSNLNSFRDIEIIIINDGSEDDSERKILAERLPHIKYIRNRQNRGRGYSLSRAFKDATGDNILYCDADIKINRETIDLFESALAESDVVVGRRTSQTCTSFSRAMLSKTYNFLARKLINQNLNDFQCGIKGIKRKKYYEIAHLLKEKRWSWDTELIMQSTLHGFSISEIPVNLQFYARLSKVQITRDAFRMAACLVKFYFQIRNQEKVRQHFNRLSKGYGKSRYSGLKKTFYSEKEELCRMVCASKGELILDVGCGDGFYTKIFKSQGAEVLGIDISEKMVYELSHSDIRCEVADMSNFCIAQRFDKICVTGSLEFTSDCLSSLETIRRHLKKNGCIYIMFPRASIGGYLYYWYYAAKGLRIHIFSPGQIQSLLRESRFRNIQVKKANFLTAIATATK